MDMSKADEEMAVVDAFIADDIVWHEIGRAEPRRGKDELRATMSEFSDTTIRYELHEHSAADQGHVRVLGHRGSSRRPKRGCHDAARRPAYAVTQARQRLVPRGDQVVSEQLESRERLV